nr:14120_t:CDS:2 [Entrophospora candida]
MDVKQNSSQTPSSNERKDKRRKIMFFNGLSLDNKKVLIRFGMDKPLDELVEHLERILASQTDGTKFMFRKMIQDPVQYLTSIQA